MYSCNFILTAVLVFLLVVENVAMILTITWVVPEIQMDSACVVIVSSDRLIYYAYVHVSKPLLPLNYEPRSSILCLIRCADNFYFLASLSWHSKVSFFCSQCSNLFRHFAWAGVIHLSSHSLHVMAVGLLFLSFVRLPPLVGLSPSLDGAYQQFTATICINAGFYLGIRGSLSSVGYPCVCFPYYKPRIWHAELYKHQLDHLHWVFRGTRLQR